MYKIEFKKSVLKDILKTPKAFLEKIEKAINEVAKNPTPTQSKKIQGRVDHYRIRVGMYRVVYKVEKKIEIVTVVKVGHRKEVYRFF